MIEKEREEQGGAAATPGSLPWGFEQRAKVRDAEAKAYDAAAKATVAAGGAGPSAALTAAFSGDRHAAPPGVSVPSTSATGDVTSDPASDVANISPESALVHVAVHSLETLAKVLRAKPVPLSAEDRAAFAAAMKRAMDAVMHCRA